MVRWTARYSAGEPRLNQRAFVQNHAADFAALADPIAHDRDERDFFAGRDARKNLRVPDRDVGVIEIAGVPVAIPDIDDAGRRGKRHWRPDPSRAGRG